MGLFEVIPAIQHQHQQPLARVRRQQRHKPSRRILRRVLGRLEVLRHLDPAAGQLLEEALEHSRQVGVVGRGADEVWDNESVRLLRRLALDRRLEARNFLSRLGEALTERRQQRRLADAGGALDVADLALPQELPEPRQLLLSPREPPQQRRSMPLEVPRCPRQSVLGLRPRHSHQSPPRLLR